MERFNNYLHHVCVTRVKFGERGSLPIDQTPAQSFNIDPHTGRPMSDIQRLVHIQNDLQLASEFAQLKEFKAHYVDADMSDSDALKFACPRVCQLPSEMLDFHVKQVSSRLQAKQQELAFKQEQEEIDKQNEVFDKIINNVKSD